jgi:hypothetical protein
MDKLRRVYARTASSLRVEVAPLIVVRRAPASCYCCVASFDRARSFPHRPQNSGPGYPNALASLMMVIAETPTISTVEEMAQKIDVFLLQCRIARLHSDVQAWFALVVVKEHAMVALRIAALVLGVTLGVAASWVGFWGVAAEDNSPPPVGPHRHYTVTDGSGKVYIGPNFCDNDVTSQGFAAFHHKVHIAMLPSDEDVVVLSEGC